MRLETKYGVWRVTERAVERVWAIAIGFGVSLEEAVELIIECPRTKQGGQS
jgi:hypothetical protein